MAKINRSVDSVNAERSSISTYASPSTSEECFAKSDPMMGGRGRERGVLMFLHAGGKGAGGF